MAYADAAYYTTYLCGKSAVIDTALFPFYSKQASKYIDRLTFGNITTATEDVKDCTCEIAEYLYRSESTRRADGIKSETIGQYSVTYDTTGATEEEVKNKAILSICKKWLGDSGLMYCGVM